MITWTILAPLAAGVLAIRWTVRGWRARRAGEADLTALLEDLGISGLMLGFGAAAMLHPLGAGVFLGIAAASQIGDGIDARRRKRLPSPANDGRDSG